MTSSPEATDRSFARPRLGLTGGVAAGKSTVAVLLRDLGAQVIDADLLAREVVAVGTGGLADVVSRFGPAVLGEDGALDRKKLGEIVFSDPEARADLEAIVHPRVRARADEVAASAEAGVVVVHEIPLLVETAQAAQFDAIVVVDVPVDVQLERLVNRRGLSEREAWSRIRSQASRESRLAQATWVVDNTGTLDDLRRQATMVFEGLRQVGR
ncbi:MAG: dephospho-CoA kinase [Nocardioides sp.]